MKYYFKAQTAGGTLSEGTREASDKSALASLLRNDGLSLVFAREEKGLKIFDPTYLNHIFVRISLHEKIIFSKNLAAMLKAGLSLARALSVLERQTENFRLREITRSLSDDISKGLPFSDGLKKFPRIFPSLFVAMVKAGEESGGLPGALLSIAAQLEKNYVLTRKIRGALIYPAIILIAIIGIGALMLIYVVPSLTQTFADMRVELPASTQFVINLSNLLVEHTLSTVLVTAGVIMAMIFFGRTPRGKGLFHRAFLKIPLVGNLVREVNSARTARTLSSLLFSGVDIRHSLSITGEVLQNVHFKKALLEAEAGIEKGFTLSSILKNHPELYPPMVGEMIEVGEESGKLHDMLVNIADFYEEEVDNATRDMSTVIEPFLMIVIGAAVGFFAVSMITPMYSVLNTI